MPGKSTNACPGLAGLVDFRGWPDWWEGLERIEQLGPGGSLDKGSRIRSSWRGMLPHCPFRVPGKP